MAQNIEVKMKQLQRSPVTLSPPDPNSILYNHPWLSGLDISVLKALQKYANLSARRQGDALLQYGEVPEGIFIIVSGLVKVCMSFYSDLLAVV
jgi:CRP-like cAMP-binding protein